jgi:hypothetical protein
MTLLCKFCPKETVYVPLSIKGGVGDNSFHMFEVHYCYDCKAEYVDWAENTSIHLYTMINNRMYRWSIEGNGTTGRLWYVGEPGEPGIRPNRKLSLVKSFTKDFPPITPQNIERKLRFMLLFL